MSEGDKKSEPSDVIGGVLNIFGLNIDLAKLSPEEVQDRLEELRTKLKQAGGKELLGDEAWRRGETTIGGHLRTRGILGEREYHIGTAGPAKRQSGREKEPVEAVAPPVDVFYEKEEIVVVAEVPGVDLKDVELTVQEDSFTLATKPSAPRSYRKEIPLHDHIVDLKATCRNGILEVHLRRGTS
ncbi:MAG: Hsp20/alpha crystallin family protein [Chloroflexi bacterium]|nr:Hsp20/alpha crystallin family protein [Chloroflexota bacterium]